MDLKSWFKEDFRARWSVSTVLSELLIIFHLFNLKLQKMVDHDKSFDFCPGFLSKFVFISITFVKMAVTFAKKF